jgi:hypothetical protein
MIIRWSEGCSTARPGGLPKEFENPNPKKKRVGDCWVLVSHDQYLK